MGKVMMMLKDHVHTNKDERQREERGNQGGVKGTSIVLLLIIGGRVCMTKQPNPCFSRCGTRALLFKPPPTVYSFGSFKQSTTTTTATLFNLLITFCSFVPHKTKKEKASSRLDPRGGQQQQ
jgi:hypothetical protein